MPFAKILPSPGVNVEFSPTLNKAGWSGSNLMRFRMGLPEKLGGWLPLSPTPVVGTGLGMHTWADATPIAYCMIGTDQRLQVISLGVLYDITPIRTTSNVGVDFSTIINTSIVTIVSAASNTAAGDWVYIVVPVSVGGVVLQGFYKVVTTVNANSYTVDAGYNATSTVNNGGAVPLFTTTMASAVVKVTLANHGLITGNNFYVEVSTTVGAVVLSGRYTVTRLNANDFDITASGVAGSSTTGSENGGDARFEYLLASGFGQNTLLSGYGIGAYGAGPYGMASGATFLSYLRQWTGDSWGADLVCTYTGGPIYEWVPPIAGTLPGNIATNPATVLAAAPSINTTLFVHSQSEILVSCGNNHSGGFDPLLVAWSDQDDLTVWTAASGNQAGSFRLKSGSRIVGAMMVSQSGLIWTDTGLYVMQYIGYPDVFGFTLVGTNCGLIALRAAGVLNSTVYWMGRDNFYAASPGGAPIPLTCPVWDIVFRNLNTQQLEEIVCAVNPLFNEVGWFFASATGTGAVDTYVKYNAAEQTWDYGNLQRTCWDEGLVFGAPMGCDGTGLVQQHETSPDANGSPLAYSFQTGFFDIAEGEEFLFVDQIWPDFVETPGAIVQITVSTVDYPGQNPRVYGPYSMTQGTKQFIALNARGRQMSVAFSGNDVGSFVRLGSVRYRYGLGAGRRGGG